MWGETIRTGTLWGLLHTGQSAASVAKTFAGKQPVYLATPYSAEVVGPLGWDFALSMRLQRLAAAAASDLALLGVSAVSPIVLSAQMVHATQRFLPGRGRDASPWDHAIDPLDHAFWMSWCQPIFNACHAVVVPDIPGWSRSKGVRAEVEAALMLNMPVYVYAQGVEA